MASHNPDILKNKLNINEWAEEDRPREKLMRLGASSLTDAELLAILIGSGSTRESAVDLTRRILSDCNNNLNTLGKKQIADLVSYHGMGPAKAIAIVAACELGRRRRESMREERPKLGSATAIYNYMHPILQDLDVEEFHILLMNQQYSLIREMCVSRGGITETAVDVRVIMRECLFNNATILAVTHNHPSGNLIPSSHDDEITRQIKKACDTMRIYFTDHVIVTDGNYYSYHEEGRL